MRVRAPFYCQQMICEGSGVIARYALMGDRLDFIGWVNDGSWDLKPDMPCEADTERQRPPSAATKENER